VGEDENKMEQAQEIAPVNDYRYIEAAEYRKAIVNELIRRRTRRLVNEWTFQQVQ
jgi:hypothetical protein